MADSSDKPKRRINPLIEEEEFRVITEPAKPRVMPDFVEKHLQAADQKRVSAAEELPPPPRWPMLSGIFTFPFYLNTLASWMFMTLGLMLTGWLFMFWLEYGTIGGVDTAYYLGLPVFAAGILTFGYTTSCCFTIIEGTSTGWDSVEIPPELEWKEWVWHFFHITVLLLQAGMFGYAIQLISPADSLMPCLFVTLAFFPLVLLGALAADGAWVPLAIGKVLGTFIPIIWAWVFFYLETTPMIVGWTYMVREGLASPAPWLVPLYAGPLLAIIILIYARLIGRLGLCIAKVQSNQQSEGNEDE
jgi:hypothetical protein